MPEYTEEQKAARQKAVRNYEKNNYRLNIVFPKGTKERIEKLAAKNEADRIAQEQQAQAEEAAREKRVKKDQERVAQEKAQSGNP